MFERFRKSEPWRPKVIWALDLETTGLSPKKDRILSVGMVPIREGRIRWGEHDHRLVRSRTEKISPPSSMRVHNILPDETREAEDLEFALDFVLPRLADGVLLVHFEKLDVGFLKAACERRGRTWPDPSVVDTMRLMHKLAQQQQLLRPHGPRVPRDLAGARKFVGLPPHLAHDALQDALATAELFLVLADRMELETMRELR